MLTSALLLAVGLATLLGGGDLLVRGGSGIAAALGVSPLVIGLAFGTSAPELVVSITGSLQDQGDLVYGNVVGSNLSNIGLVLGITLLLVPIAVQGQVVRREIPLLILASVMMMVMVLDAPLRGQSATLDRSDGLTLLLLFALFMYVTVGDVLRERAEDALLRTVSAHPVSSQWHLLRHIAMLLGGMLALMIGGQLTIDNGVAVAKSLGISDVVIGLTLVAVGTSLPELVTSAIAAWRREADMAVGNLIGSNLFNLLFVLPIASLVQPIRVPAGGVTDGAAVLLLTLLLLPLAISARYVLDRRDASVLIVIYVGYMLWRTVWPHFS